MWIMVRHDVKPVGGKGAKGRRGKCNLAARHPVDAQSPLIAMYVTGANLIPMPFRSSIEKALGRPAITLLDMSKASASAYTAWQVCL